MVIIGKGTGLAHVEQGANILSDSGKQIRYVRKCNACDQRFEPEKVASTYSPPSRGHVGGDDFQCPNCGPYQKVVIGI